MIEEHDRPEPDEEATQEGESVANEESTVDALARTRRDLDTADKQRGFLMRQVESLAQRLAGAHMAAGFLDVSGAAVFAQQELARVNGGMGQIFQATQAQATRERD